MSLSYLPNLLDPLINYCPLFSEGKSKQVNKSQSNLSVFCFFFNSFLEEATKFAFSFSQPPVLTQGSQSDTEGCVFVWKVRMQRSPFPSPSNFGCLPG